MRGKLGIAILAVALLMIIGGVGTAHAGGITPPPQGPQAVAYFTWYTPVTQPHEMLVSDYSYVLLPNGTETAKYITNISLNWNFYGTAGCGSSHLTYIKPGQAVWWWYSGTAQNCYVLETVHAVVGGTHLVGSDISYGPNID